MKLELEDLDAADHFGNLGVSEIKIRFITTLAMHVYAQRNINRVLVTFVVVEQQKVLNILIVSV
jgi:hypothetical protein